MSREVADWKERGVYRLSIELPIEVWQGIKRQAAIGEVSAAHVIRGWLVERLRHEDVIFSAQEHVRNGDL